MGVRRLTPVGHTCVCNAYAGSVRRHNVYAHDVCACACKRVCLDVGVRRKIPPICSSMNFFESTRNS